MGVKVHRHYLRVLEQLSLRQHPLVQDSGNENSIFIGPVKNNMLPLFDAPVSLANLIARSPDLSCLNQALKAIVKTVEVPFRLC